MTASIPHWTAALRRAVGLAVIVLLLSTDAPAALPPGAVETLKSQAPEILDVEVMTAQKETPRGARYSVFYRARVLEVVRSKEPLTPGAEILIDSYALTEGAHMIGPKAPALLPIGWRGRVWLTPAPHSADPGAAPRFIPAAYGYSFEPE